MRGQAQLMWMNRTDSAGRRVGATSGVYDGRVRRAQFHGDVAQLARAPALQAGGRGFESHRLHHSAAGQRLAPLAGGQRRSSCHPRATSVSRATPVPVSASPSRPVVESLGPCGVGPGHSLTPTSRQGC